MIHPIEITANCWAINGMVVILQGEVPLGEFVPVKIDGALTYDLTGQVELKRGLNTIAYAV